MTDMQKIQRVFKEVYDIDTDISEDGMSLHGRDDLIVVHAEAPRGDNGYRWVARLAPAVIFDDWWYTDFIEESDHDFTDSVDVFCETLRNNNAESYRKLFALMSLNYKDLWDEHKELSEDWLRKSEDIDRINEYVRVLEE